MHTFPIKSILIILLAMIMYSCTKEEPVVQEKYNTKVNITSPVIQTHYLMNDTIHIQAVITSDVSMHGYEIILHKENEGPLSLKSKHTHGMSISIDENWIVNMPEKKSLSIEIVALIDHLGNQLSEKVEVVCN